MSEAVRAVALAEAIKSYTEGGAEPAVILKTAESYLKFLQGGATAPATRTAAGSEPPKETTKPPPSDAAKKAAAAAAAKVAAAKKAEEEAAKKALEKANAEAGGDEGEGGPEGPFDPADEASVGAIVGALIKADKRQDAINLLKLYKAKSQSELAAKGEAIIAKFVAAGNELLGFEAEPDLES